MDDRMEPSTRNSRHVSLLEEIRCRIDRVVDAIHRVTTTKRRMQDGITEVKSEIQSGVSSQLSAIRDREVWLLDQVDRQCQLKVDALTTQGDSLQQSLGQLCGLLRVSTGQSDDGGDHCSVDSQIGDILESTKGDDLRPVTTPELRFKVDNAALLRAIHNYGCVDPNGLPFDSCVHPDWTSASLPRAIEDYGDPSHNVLYKTVADVRQSQRDDNSQIQVVVPRLHPGSGAWLYPAPCPEPCPQPTEHSAFCWNIPHSLSQPSDSTSSSSLHQWLLDIQNEADVDDNNSDFEMIGCFTNQPGESVSPKRDATKQLPVSMTVFQEVIKSPSSSWLQNASSDETDTDVLSCLCEASPKEANSTREADLNPAIDSMADWIHVAPTSRLPVSDLCRSHDVSSSEARRHTEVKVMHDMAMNKWPLEQPLHSPSADLLYFHHFAIVLDSPSSDWLQHGYASSTTTCRHELLKQQISDWLMLQSSHVKEVPVQA